jgi:hypothetical protein
MAYLINKSDGTTLTTIPDGQIDDITTDLILIGKNYSGFGEALNENFVKLLENFSGNSRPIRPVRGQIWFDTTELKLKVYNGTAFQPVSSATISNTQPSTLTPGDLWFNDIDKQLYFFDGVNPLLLGPSFSNSQGLSGFRVSTILDSLNQSRTITLLYNNGTLMGIFAKERFIPKFPIEGFSGEVFPGFNEGTLDGIKFRTTATNADTLGIDVTNYPEGIPSDAYIKNYTNGVINGRLGVTNGIEFGDGFQHKLIFDNGNLIISNTVSNKNITLSALRSSSQEDALRIEPDSRTIKLYDGYINSEVITGGNLTVNGNLTVVGETVSVDVSVVRVENKVIELGISGDSTVQNDETIDRGGIVLKSSDNDKEWIYNNARQAWQSNQNISLDEDRYYAIGDTVLLRKTGSTFELTSAVTAAPGIEIFGNQAQFAVRNLYFVDNRISIEEVFPTGGPYNADLELEPGAGGDVVLVGSPKITGLGEPGDIQDAATKNYVDTQISSRALAFSLDISDGISNDGIAGWLNLVAPPSDFQPNTVARVLCSSLTNASGVVDVNTYTNKSTGTFNTPAGTGTAITDFTFDTLPIPSQSIIVSRSVKTFQNSGSAWFWVSG